MKKIILTSNGFVNHKIWIEFLNILEKPINESKILFIPIAARTEEELHYVRLSKEELLNNGVLEENIYVYTQKSTIEEKELKTMDAIYVCGGNTCYLLHKIRILNLDDKIKSLVLKGKIYIGVSAGSIITNPNIRVALPFDENDIDLTDFTALFLNNIFISPHYSKEEEKIIKQLEKEMKVAIVRLKDGEAIILKDNKIKKIY